MPIEYFHDRRITPAQFVELLKRSTLAERRPVQDLNRISDMLAHGNLLATAWDGARLVGVSRSLTDFSFCCYLSDLAVDAGYQRQGIGRKLIEVTRARLHPQCKIILLAAPKSFFWQPQRRRGIIPKSAFAIFIPPGCWISCGLRREPAPLPFRLIPNIDNAAAGVMIRLAMSVGKERHDQLSERLMTSGFRFTPQREHVYNVLLQDRDHPTAEEVFIRAKNKMPDISMATVYNCLDALVRCGLVRQVTLERGAARFCPNMQEHSHFYCDVCSSIFDVALSPEASLPLPKGFRANRFDITIHGSCPACASGRK